jgi:hypothetical protein
MPRVPRWRPEIRTPADGKAVAWTRPEDAEKFSVSTVWEGAKLKQTFTGEDGRRVNTYSLQADGKTLTMQVEVTSTRLKSLLLKYQLAYKRTTAARPDVHPNPPRSDVRHRKTPRRPAGRP